MRRPRFMIGRAGALLVTCLLPQACDSMWHMRAGPGDQGWTYGVGTSAVHAAPNQGSFWAMGTVWQPDGTQPGAGFQARYLPRKSKEWERGPKSYFGGNESLRTPPWFARFLTDNATNVEEDVVVWAPDLLAPDPDLPYSALLPSWRLYYSAYNLKLNKACIGMAFANLTEDEELPAYGPVSWEDHGEPLICSYGRDTFSYQVDDDYTDDGGNVTHTTRTKTKWVNDANDTFYRTGNASTLYGPTDALEPSVFYGDNHTLWMVYGSSLMSTNEGQRGLFLVQLNPRTGLLSENMSAVPQRLFTGRLNATIGSPYIFRYPRGAFNTNKSWYFLFYTEEYDTDYQYYLDQPEVRTPSAVLNHTRSIRVVRAPKPWGPYEDRDNNRAGVRMAGTLIMNTTLAKSIRLTDRKSLGIRNRYTYRREGYPDLWDRYNGPVRKSSLGYAPFCSISHPAVQHYGDDARGRAKFVMSFTYYECEQHTDVPTPYFAALEMNFGPQNLTYNRPWPEVGGVWDPFVYAISVPTPFPVLLVVIPLVTLISMVIVYRMLILNAKRLKSARVNPGTVIDRARPWWAVFVDPVVLCCNSVSFKFFGRIVCVTMDPTDALIEKYSDALGEVLKIMDAYDIDNAQRLRWLQKWETMDKDGNNGLDFSEFRAYFKLPDDYWSKQIFEMFSQNFNAQISFEDFLRGAYTMLVYDRSMIYSFAFRLLSRRGSTFDSNFDILDKIDFTTFVQARYPELDHMGSNKRAEQIFSYIDEDNCGGVSYPEFQRFCRANFTFLLFGHQYQEQLRAGLFGAKYWKQQTASRQDIYVYDKKFLQDLGARSERDHPPFIFERDFEEVYESLVDKRAERLRDKKKLMEFAFMSNAHEFEGLKKAAQLLSRATGLNMRHAFYHWKTLIEDDRCSSMEFDSIKMDPVHPSNEALKYALHARILDEQRRQVATAEEAIAMHYGLTVGAMNGSMVSRPKSTAQMLTAAVDADDWGQLPCAFGTFDEQDPDGPDGHELGALGSIPLSDLDAASDFKGLGFAPGSPASTSASNGLLEREGAPGIESS